MEGETDEDANGLPAIALLFSKRNDIIQPYYAMTRDLLIIGRKHSPNDCSVDIDLAPVTHYVSRKHFRIRIPQYDKPFIGDVLGKNGVFIDGVFYRAGISVELPAKSFLRFPSTDICISFVSLLQYHETSVDPNSIFQNSLANSKSFESANCIDKANNKINITRPFSPTGTISAFNSRPSSPHRNQSSAANFLASTSNYDPCSSAVLEHTCHASIAEESVIDAVVTGDNVGLDDDLIWNTANERNGAITMGMVSGNVTANNSVDFHDSDAQMPPLNADDSIHRLIASQGTQFPGESNQVTDILSQLDATVSQTTAEGRQDEDTNKNSNNGNNGDKGTSASRVTQKPSKLSYIQMIAQALSSSSSLQMQLKGIYEFISQQYPKYRMTDRIWQNSVRRTLSTSPYFVKVERKRGEPCKGLWTLSAAYKDRQTEITIGQKRRTKRLNPLPPKQKPIVPANIINQPISQFLPVSLMPSTESAVPFIQPVTILLSSGEGNTVTTPYAILPQQQLQQQQLVYFQCIDSATATTTTQQPSASAPTIVARVGPATASTSLLTNVSIPTTCAISTLRSPLQSTNVSRLTTIRPSSNVTAYKSRSPPSKPQQSVMIGSKKMFLTPVDISPCSSSSSFSSYFPTH